MLASFLLENVEIESLAEIEECIEKRQAFEIIATGPQARELKDSLYLGREDSAPISPAKLSGSTVMLVFGFTTVGLLSRSLSLGFKVSAHSQNSDEDRVNIKFEPPEK